MIGDDALEKVIFLIVASKREDLKAAMACFMAGCLIGNSNLRAKCRELGLVKIFTEAISKTKTEQSLSVGRLNIFYQLSMF